MVTVGSETTEAVTGEDPPEDVCSVPVTNVEFCVSGSDVDEVCDVKVEVDSVVNGEDSPWWISQLLVSRSV